VKPGALITDSLGTKLRLELVHQRSLRTVVLHEGDKYLVRSQGNGHVVSRRQQRSERAPTVDHVRRTYRRPRLYCPRP
jgi:hypothetical protein